MKYLAFDIEAANGYQPSSICSIGIVIADTDFNILNRENIWINPRTKYNLNGTRKNIGIDLHLDKELLDNSPDFSQVYNKVRDLLTDTDTLVFGHAVDSDVRMLNAACERYKLPCIEFKFLCSQLLYRLHKGEKDVKALYKIAAELDALGYPAALRDLMAANNVDDAILRHAVFQRGCYPEAMPVAQYAPELVANIVGKWPQWLDFIRENSDIPF